MAAFELFSVVFFLAPVFAQAEISRDAAQNQSIASPEVSRPAALDLSVTGAACFKDGQAHQTCQMGDDLVIEFKNLKEWMSAAPDRNKTENFVLFLNGVEMKGLKAKTPDVECKRLSFPLPSLNDDGPSREDGSRDAWSMFRRAAKPGQALSAGIAVDKDQPFIPVPGNGLKVDLLPQGSIFVWLLLLALLIAFLIMAVKSDILRDAPTPPGSKKLSFSLGRTQMAWWLFIVVSSYLYILIVVGIHDCLTQGALILTGISGGTAALSYAVDANKRGQRVPLEKQKAGLTSQLAALDAKLADPATAGQSADTLSAQKDQLAGQLAKINDSLSGLPSLPDVSEGFIFDILRDETGISLHRFQMVVWTLILGAVFVIDVYKNLAMPDFGANLLALLGVSGGVYVGFKLPDSNT